MGLRLIGITSFAGKHELNVSVKAYTFSTPHVCQLHYLSAVNSLLSMSLFNNSWPRIW